MHASTVMGFSELVKEGALAIDLGKEIVNIGVLLEFIPATEWLK